MRWKQTFFILGAAAVGLGVIVAYWSVAAERSKPAPADAASTPAPAPIAAPFVTVVDPSKGPKDADVTIIEFGDHACPYCRSTQEAVDALMKAYPTRVRFVWKSAPSPLHPGSEIAAEAALCAERQGKFWEYHDRLFKDPTTLDQSSMVILASELRLDPADFGECLSTEATRPLVERTVTEAHALGLTGIPTVYVNGTRYEGAMDYAQLLEAARL